MSRRNRLWAEAAKKWAPLATKSDPSGITRFLAASVEATIAEEQGHPVMGVPDGALADTFVMICDGVVHVTYDGAGWDYLSCDRDTWGASQLRERIEATVASMGYHIEDRNSWSFGVFAS